MSDFKEYRSVTEFPARTEKLNRQELIEHYNDLRQTYKNLNTSRGQLVRRQREAKGKIVDLNQDIQDKQQELRLISGNLKQNQLKLKQAEQEQLYLNQQIQGKSRELQGKQQELKAISGNLKQNQLKLKQAEREQKYLYQEIQKKDRQLLLKSEELEIANVSVNQKNQELVQKDQELQRTLIALERSQHSLKKVEDQRQNVIEEISYLKAERQAIDSMIKKLSSEYRAVNNDAGILGTIPRLSRMMKAVLAFLSTDVTELIQQQKRLDEQDES